MQNPRRVFLFDGAADVADACAGEGLAKGLSQSSGAVDVQMPSLGPTRAAAGAKAKRRSFISFASRTVEINSALRPGLARSSSMASMSPTKRSASPPPRLTRGDSVVKMNTSRSIPKDLGSSERDEIVQVQEAEEHVRRVSAEDPLLKDAMENVQLRKRVRTRKSRVVLEDLALREPSPLSPEDDWNDDDIPTDNTDNAKIVGDYLLGGALGKGTFGTVYKALHTVTGEFVAIKEITTHGTEDMTAVMGEVELLKRLNHPNIVEFKDIRRKNNKYYIALEFIENGSLKDVLNKFGLFPESLALVYVIQLLQGLAYLHDANIIHRDIKGANILITKNGTCKLADFGLAAELRDRSVKDPAGSVFWMAPELFDVEGAAGTSKASDIWSLGCTVLELLTGKPPYSHLSSMAAIHAIVEDEHPPLPDCSKDLQDFLRCCLKKSPNERMTANQLLQHRWIVRQTPQKSGDYRMLTRQLRDFRKHSGSLPSPLPTHGKLRSRKLRRQSVSGLTKGNLLVRRLSKLTSACPTGRLQERLEEAGVELNEEALHVLETQEQLYGKLSILASELHCDLVAAQDGADELSAKRMEAESEASKLVRTMENMRGKLKLLEENFNQSDEVLASLVYGNLSMARFGTDVKKGVLKVKRPHDKWRKRHVLLKDNFVLLFKPEDSTTPADVLWLDRVAIEPQSAKLVGEKFAFRLNTRKRTLLVCAANDKIMVGWMKELSFPTPWYEADDFEVASEPPRIVAPSPPMKRFPSSALLGPSVSRVKPPSPLAPRRKRTLSNPSPMEAIEVAQPAPPAPALPIADDAALNTKGFLSLTDAADVSAMTVPPAPPMVGTKAGLAAKILSIGKTGNK